MSFRFVSWMGVIYIFSPCSCFYVFGLFLAFAPFSLHLASLCFFSVVTCCRFQHGSCAGVVLRRSAWSRGAPSSIAALCVACVSVVVSVNSCVQVRIFHLGSWGGPLLFREPADLQSPMEAAAPPSQLLHYLSALDIEEQPTPPS